MRASLLPSMCIIVAGCGTGQFDRVNTAMCTEGLVGQAVSAINSTGPVPEGCVKIEGEQIGALPQTIALPSGTVTITGWTAKEGEADEQVGFSFTASSGVGYAVKAAGRTFAGSSSTWVHPEGVSGSSASGISNITFCPNSGGEGGDEGSVGGEGGDEGSTGGEDGDEGSVGGECTSGGGGSSDPSTDEGSTGGEGGDEGSVGGEGGDEGTVGGSDPSTGEVEEIG